jgi:hypothetical protein
MGVEPPTATNEEYDDSRSTNRVCENRWVQGQIGIVGNPLNVAAFGRILPWAAMTAILDI